MNIQTEFRSSDVPLPGKLPLKSHAISKQGSERTDCLAVVLRRLRSLRNSLFKLNERPFHPETLHDARVASRRAESVLRICRDILSDRHVTWLQSRLRKLRRACNSARDNDVLCEWLEGQSDSASLRLRKSLKRKRQADRSLIVEITGSLIRRKKLARHAKLACDTAIAPGELDHWHHFVVRRLLDELYEFARTLPTDVHNAGQLHQLRIAGKRLRYSCEFVSKVIPAAGFDALLRLLKEVQDRLGLMHDTVVRQELLSQEGWQSNDPQVQCKSANEVDGLTKAWKDWWTSASPETVIGSATTRMLTLMRCP